MVGDGVGMWDVDGSCVGGGVGVAVGRSEGLIVGSPVGRREIVGTGVGGSDGALEGSKGEHLAMLVLPAIMKLRPYIDGTPSTRSHMVKLERFRNIVSAARSFWSMGNSLSLRPWMQFVQLPQSITCKRRLFSGLSQP